MGRAPCCEKIGLKKGRWNAKEDEILRNYILSHGEGSWRSLPKNAGLLRCGKSCRLRWINYLRSDVKRGNFTPREQDTIVKLHSTLGNRWSLIASQLEGRTDNEIKNYWNSHLSRKIHYFKKHPTINDAKNTITTTAATVVQPQPPRKGRGRTSRANMKKNKLSTKIVNNDSNNDNNVNTNNVVTSLAEGVVAENNYHPMCFDHNMTDPHWALTSSMSKEKSPNTIDHESWSNAGESSSHVNCFDQDHQVWMSAHQSNGGGENQDELLSWLMWDNDDRCLEEALETDKDREEAMLAWLLS